MTRQIEVMWRTPSRQEPGINADRLRPIDVGELGGMNRHFDKETGRMAQIGLTQQVQLRKVWPTPAQRDYKGSRTTEQLLAVGRNPSSNSLGDAIGEGNVKGQLNPDWVCWLMGWPIGWESLGPIKELTWLDWSVDPADMEVPENWNTPKYTEFKTDVNDSGEYAKRCEAGGFQLSVGQQVKLKGKNTGPIPRVATGIKDRVNRLKALGNGQVPLQAATAFRLLTGDGL